MDCTWEKQVRNIALLKNLIHLGSILPLVFLISSANCFALGREVLLNGLNEVSKIMKK